MNASKEETVRQQEAVKGMADSTKGYLYVVLFTDPQSRDWFFIRMMKYLRSTRKRRLPSVSPQHKCTHQNMVVYQCSLFPIILKINIENLYC